MHRIPPVWSNSPRFGVLILIVEILRAAWTFINLFLYLGIRKCMWNMWFCLNFYRWSFRPWRRRKSWNSTDPFIIQAVFYPWNIWFNLVSFYFIWVFQESFLYKLTCNSLVRNDFERFDADSFCVADVDNSRLVFFIFPSREPMFLFRTPDSIKKLVPWEISFKSVMEEPPLYQSHFEFVESHVLPNWYKSRQVCQIAKTTVLPLQGKLIIVRVYYFISLFYIQMKNSEIAGYHWIWLERQDLPIHSYRKSKSLWRPLYKVISWFWKEDLIHCVLIDLQIVHGGHQFVLLLPSRMSKEKTMALSSILPPK